MVKKMDKMMDKIMDKRDDVNLCDTCIHESVCKHIHLINKKLMEFAKEENVNIAYRTVKCIDHYTVTIARTD